MSSSTQEDGELSWSEIEGDNSSSLEYVTSDDSDDEHLMFKNEIEEKNENMRKRKFDRYQKRVALRFPKRKLLWSQRTKQSKKKL